MARKSWLFLAIPLVAAAIWVGAFHKVIWPNAAPGTSAEKRIMPELNLQQDVDGPETPVSKLLAGAPATVFVLWASWCEPCVRELPLLLKNIARLKKEGVQIVPINYDGGNAAKTIPEVHAWLVSQKLEGLNTYFDPDEKLLQTLQISALPFSIAVANDHKIRWMKLGELDWSTTIKVD